MKLEKAIKIVNETKPHNFSEERIKGFIEECDKRIYRDITEHFENDLSSYGERYPLESSDELIADDAYSMLYVWYAISQIDIFNGESERYVNDLIQFNDYYTEFESYYGRTHTLKTASFKIITD